MPHHHRAPSTERVPVAVHRLPHPLGQVSERLSTRRSGRVVVGPEVPCAHDVGFRERRPGLPLPVAHVLLAKVWVHHQRHPELLGQRFGRHPRPLQIRRQHPVRLRDVSNTPGLQSRRLGQPHIRQGEVGVTVAPTGLAHLRLAVAEQVKVRDLRRRKRLQRGAVPSHSVLRGPVARAAHDVSVEGKGPAQVGHAHPLIRPVRPTHIVGLHANRGEAIGGIRPLLEVP